MNDAGSEADKAAIRELIENWVLWRDAGLWDRFLSVWHDDGYMMATWFQGPAQELRFFADRHWELVASRVLDAPPRDRQDQERRRRSSLAQPYLWFHRHTGPQLAQILSAVKRYPDWEPLHNFDVVAGRVLWGKQIVKRPRRAGHVLDVPVEVTPERINVNRDRLTRTHPGELRFLEIRGYPELVLGQRQQALSGLYTLTELGAAIADDSVRGRGDARVTQVELRLIERSLRRLDLCLTRCDGAQGARRRSLVRFHGCSLGPGGRVILIKTLTGKRRSAS